MNINFYNKKKEKISKDFDFISFYGRTHGNYLNQPLIRNFFLEELNFESSPFEFKIPFKDKSKDLIYLSNRLKKTFNIVFSPTYDLFQKIDKKSPYGVVSEKNFTAMKNLYEELLNQIYKNSHKVTTEEFIDDIKKISCDLHKLCGNITNKSYNT